VLIKPKIWERHGLKPWIEAARKRLHHNVLAIALANKLARIAWSVLARGRAVEARKMDRKNPLATHGRTIHPGRSLPKRASAAMSALPRSLVDPNIF